MSLPNYLAKIKSAGIYRFVWDKSIAPIQAADTLRLVVGYSEKGPFNTPVYIDNTADFKTIFGGISKKLEKKGIFFHRMALQALAGGPILALNLKKFKEEEVNYVTFDSTDKAFTETKKANVIDIYNTNRFWSLDPDVLPEQLDGSKYLSLTATDSKETSCTVFLRKYKPTGYDVTVKTWYSSRGEEIPSYLESCQDMLLEDTFAEIYVFRGKFDAKIAKSAELKNYFDVTDDKVLLKPTITNAFNEEVDTLEALAEDECSNFINVYRGTLIPYFKDNTNTYISLDLVFNLDNSKHKMLMKLDQDLLEDTDDVASELNPSGWVYEAAKEATTRKATTEEIAALQVEYDKIKDDVERGKFLVQYGIITLDQYSKDEKGNVTIKTFDVKEEATSAINFAITPMYLEGYTYSTVDMKKDGSKMQTEILSVLTDYKGIIEALTNNVDVEYHYIVDTFESFAGSASSIKTELASIAKRKDNCLAILNFPFMNKLVKDDNFKDDINGNTFDIKKVKKYIQLPSTTDGASWCAFYTAIALSDGTVKTYCPSAAVVSNLFMEKYGARQPYSIVAGPNYGLVTADGMVGPDYNFSRNELDFMEPYGVNCLVYIPRRGTQINSNQTAKQTPVSALSKVHVRELVIYLQDEIAAMLQSYQWEFNTQSLRDVVKAKADKLLENVQQNGGVYAFKNVCDETNNTDDVINNEMMILSTHIEPGMGAGKLVEELTIYRKGGMTSSAV